MVTVLSFSFVQSEEPQSTGDEVSLSIHVSNIKLNISTFATFEPDPLFPTSGVFRAALASFSKLFADKYAAQNIRMNNVLPGFIDSLAETQERRQRIPMGRYGKTS